MSGIVSFRKPGSSAQEIMRRPISPRLLSPHFYNTEDQVDQVLAVLAPEVARP